MHRTVFVGSEIGLGAGGKTPVGEWLLLPFGYIDVDRPVAGGPFTFTRRQADTLVQWFTRQGRALAIDYEHQTFDDCNTRPDGLRPAAGWIHGLEVRDDGLWVTGVQWSEKATALLASGEYRYFSPVIFWEPGGYTVPTSMGPVALTNDPAMLGTAALAAKQDNDGRCDASTGRSRRLVARQHTGVQVMNEIFTLLGIDPENPTIEAIEAALTDEKLPTVAALLGLGEEAARADVLAAIGAMLGVAEAVAPEAEATAEATPEEAAEQAVTAVKRLVEHCLALGRKRAASEIGKALGVKGETVQGVVALAKNKLANPPGHVSSEENKRTMAENAKLQGRLKVLEDRDVEREFDVLVLSGEHAGKIEPAQRTEYLTMFKSLGKETFTTLVLSKMPSKVSGSSTFAGDPAGGGLGGGDDDEKAWQREWTRNAANEKGVALQREFGKKTTFFAFKRANAAGQVKITGSRS